MFLACSRAQHRLTGVHPSTDVSNGAWLVSCHDEAMTPGVKKQLDEGLKLLLSDYTISVDVAGLWEMNVR